MGKKIEVSKEKEDDGSIPDPDKEKFGESGVKLLNLIAEILVENALNSATGPDSVAEDKLKKIKS